jgi:hypothetical protein
VPTGAATVSATYGPGRVATTQLITNIQAFFVNINKRMIFFYLINDDPTGPAREFALTDTVTFTATIANGSWTITVAAT